MISGYIVSAVTRCPIICFRLRYWLYFHRFPNECFQLMLICHRPVFSAAKVTKSKSEKARPQTVLFGSCFGLSTRPSENIICDLFEESVNKNLTEM